MKTRTIISIIISLLAMVAFPGLVIGFIGGIDALGILLLLIFALNPLVSIAIGILSGWGEEVQWYLPAINAAIFLIAETVITGFDFSYIIAAAVYFGIGIAAAYITKAVNNKKQ